MSWGNTSKTSVAPFPGALDNSGFNGTGEIDLNRNGQISYTRVWNPRSSRKLAPVSHVW